MASNRPTELRGFAIAGFRSFGLGMQRIGPMGKINFLAGPNNSGKSNALTFVSEHLPKIIEGVKASKGYKISGLNKAQGESIPLKLEIAITKNEKELWALVEALGADALSDKIRARMHADLVVVLRNPLLGNSDDVAWMPVQTEQPDPPGLRVPKEWRDEFLHTYTNDEATTEDSQQLWKRLSTSVRGLNNSLGMVNGWVPHFLNKLVDYALNIPEVVLVPAYRELTDDVQETFGANGKGLIREIQKLERPVHNRIRDQEKFRKIVEFVRAVLQSDDAEVEVPHEPTTLHVRVGGRTLPLSNLGTGIHQVVMIAANATLNERKLVCLEEPEMNLHPTLQRHLVRYLAEHTSNQYLISTHSAHLLDTPSAAIFRVSSPDGWTHIQSVKSANEHLDICSTLGYHASDLLQTNAVIWVEGPSDRIYLLRLIKDLASDLVEGLHFSIMFYGGRLLRHLSAHDAETVEFIELQKLNRHIAIVIDSDKESASDSINDTKSRIVDELQNGGGVVWVTAGRMIENYADAEVFKAAVSKVHPTKVASWIGGEWESPFEGIKNPDKVGIARAICDSDSTVLNRLDSGVQAAKLVGLVRRANPLFGQARADKV